MEKLDDYLRIKEAAEYLGVSPNTLRNWGRRRKVHRASSPHEQLPLVQEKRTDAAPPTDREAARLSVLYPGPPRNGFYTNYSGHTAHRFLLFAMTVLLRPLERRSSK